MINLFLLAFVIRVEASAPSPPSLDLLSSIWQPSGPDNQAVYGAPSITNAWGSLLVSTNNVLGINAIEMVPFSSGWDSKLLYGWPVDTASLFINGISVIPTATQWTPYGVIRNNSAINGDANAYPVTTEVRWVFEAQAVLFSAEIDLTSATENVTVGVDFQLPLRYYNRADNCSSWHYPTHSEESCWNWFGPEAPSGENGPSFFIPTWQPCPSSTTPYATLLQTDSRSAASTAFSFPNVCGGGGGRGNLSAPTSVNGSVALWTVSPGGRTFQLKFALVFSNASDPSSTVAAARSLADSFDSAWVDARDDWQNRFNSVFDQTLTHFSGVLPIVKTTTGGGSGDGFDSATERIYYHSIISLLANERTNLPPSYPSTDYTRSDSITESYYLEGTERVFTSNLDRYLTPSIISLLNGTNVKGFPRIRGCSFSGGGSSSDFRGGEGNSRLLAADEVHPSDLLQEDGAPWRMFMTGGGLNATTNIFYWDNQYSAQLHAMLEPLTLSRQLLLWTSGVDVDSSVPSQWSFWGLDYAAGRGVGNFYSTNDMTLFELFYTLLRVTEEYSFLNKTYTIGPFPNGTVVTTTVYKMMLSLATHWKNDPIFNVSGFLADYGQAANLLECVPTYIHRVASINAANAYMSKTFAKIALSQGDSALAAELQADADGIAAAVLDLYVPSKGFFQALYPNGTEREVRHVMDFVYVSQYLGIANSSDRRSSGDDGYIPQSIALEMKEFVQRELIVQYWMRALSLNDSAAPFSNRSDHGPSGSYIGWPALVIRSFGLSSSFADALAFLSDTLFAAQLGPYGQAIEIRPPGLPYKPMDVTLYNAMCAGGFADTIIQTLFGFVPSLALPGMPQPSSPLVKSDAYRGFDGVLYGVRWQGLLWNVESSDKGVAISIE
jgi:hypothetical protein